jgi:anti-sigma factor RsiW
MTDRSCAQTTSEMLTGYLAGDLTSEEEARFEAHLFSCDVCAGHLQELARLGAGVRDVARAAQVGGLVTDEVLNRWARDGVRVRTYALSPGEVVPCAVWVDDDMLVVRLRGNFEGLATVSVARRVSRGDAVDESFEATGNVADVPVAGAHAEIIYATPAAALRDLPSADVQLIVRDGTSDGGRTVGTYTLRHTAHVVS